MLDNRSSLTESPFTDSPVALITGAAQRIGACIARTLHQQGYSLLIHYRHSAAEANALAEELNRLRPDSCRCLQANLTDMTEVERLAEQVIELGRLDLLINNASAFYPTPVDQVTQQAWDDLINSNLRAAFFISTRLSNLIAEQEGAIINLIDIHAQRGLKGYPIYSIAKAGLQMMTQSLAKELAPAVRVNGVSPGPILWPEAKAALTPEQQHEVVSKTLLQRCGSPQDIADAVLFLSNAHYITGQILCVDGGKSLFS
ncbi:pteridine reductase [Nitrincola sp. MINF-07-Sa-05]|uniref:pteridine reductase n=1 Tax=Nitrincola salilacus TaxID=3400273 RepID=UPI003917F09F